VIGNFHAYIHMYVILVYRVVYVVYLARQINHLNLRILNPT